MTTPLKVAILGGGPAAMSSAYQLVASGKPYDITVYTMGWRLGGKIYTGRNSTPGYGLRIEEHGVHMLFGFYSEIFTMLRDVYADLGLNLKDATIPREYGALGEEINGKLNPWWLQFPQLPGDPVTGPTTTPTIVRFLVLGIKMVYEGIKGLFEQVGIKNDNLAMYSTQLGTIYAAVENLTEIENTTTMPQLDSLTTVQNILKGALAELIKHMTSSLATDARHLLEILIVGTVNVIGLIAMFLQFGFKVTWNDMDAVDYDVFLTTHGLPDDMKFIAPIRAIFLSGFAYINGNLGAPSMGTGAALCSFCHTILGYSGYMAYYFNGGTSDVVMVPVYNYLKKHGVKFNFFSKVSDIVPTTSGDNIQSVVIDLQATVIGGQSNYNPFIPVNDQTPFSWPDEPIFTQLADGQPGKDYESYYDPPNIIRQQVLRAGIDFDYVVLGIPKGTHQYIAQKLIDQKQMWANSTKKLQTSATYSMQLWFNKTWQQLGVGRPTQDPDAEYCLACYKPPYDCVAEFTHLLPHEDWGTTVPPGGLPQFLLYYTDSWDTTQWLDLPPPNANVPKLARADLFAKGSQWLTENLPAMVPNCVKADGTLDYSVFVSPSGKTGIDALNDQFWKVNLDPDQLYILSSPNTVQYRMKPDDSGYANMVLAGDWTDNSLNFGCLEACARSSVIAVNYIVSRTSYNEKNVEQSWHQMLSNGVKKMLLGLKAGVSKLASILSCE